MTLILVPEFRASMQVFSTHVDLCSLDCILPLSYVHPSLNEYVMTSFQFGLSIVTLHDWNVDYFYANKPTEQLGVEIELAISCIFEKLTLSISPSQSKLLLLPTLNSGKLLCYPHST
ncbi:hypothetical protein HS088_TW11G00846 [Tripterygium wilfordii]|uniref:Uncharacterized protein n=1 Tax=Tripterygium wilfordii TaxID=458696 RepID=A0A7J7D3C0_TRIWF|nr:hypothetical protein HS088_TW11G00846 [Tripterygium wilfordii]